MRSKSVWIAFAIGVAAGAAVALLYAPQSGIRTRRKLKKGLDEGVVYLEEAAEYLKEQADVLSKEAQKTLQRARGQMDDVMERGSSVAGSAAASAAKAVQTLM